MNPSYDSASDDSAIHDGINDPIVALATASGQGAIAVIRMSGVGILDLIREIVRSKKGRLRPFEPRKMLLLDVVSLNPSYYVL